MKKNAYPVLLVPLLGLAACLPPRSQPPPEPRGLVRSVPLIMPDLPDTLYRVQIFASRKQGDAESRVRELSVLQDEEVFLVYSEPYWKVLVGNTPVHREAMDIKDALVKLGYIDAFVVAGKRKNTNINQER